MANPEVLAMLKEGIEAWNQWRKEHPEIATPDLRHADLRNANLVAADLNRADLEQADLREANLTGANLYGASLVAANLGRANLKVACLVGTNLYWAKLCLADLSSANLRNAVLQGTDLSGAKLHDTFLWEANLIEADLREADLGQAELCAANLSRAKLTLANLRQADLRNVNLTEADLSQADLSQANLEGAILVMTNLERTNLTGCRVYGISAWTLKLEGSVQANLVIGSSDGSAIEVDNLELAQFMYLLLNSERIRQIIDTITSKAVLILGRFTPERKAVLEAIREELRKRNYIPLLFDFEKPANRDITETVSTLAHMARFVIADITDARSIPQELERIVPDLPSVPIQPLLLASQREYGMFEHFRRYPWVLEPVIYDDQQTLVRQLGEKVIAPAEAKAKEQMQK